MLVLYERGIVVDEKRPEAWHRLGDKGQRLCPDQIVERKDARVNLTADLVAQLHRKRAIAAQQEPWLGVDRHRNLPDRERAEPDVPICAAAATASTMKW